MAEYVNRSITIENVKIPNGLKNFSGRAKEFNAKGQRNFLGVIPEERVDELLDAGWPVKRFKVREEGVVPDAFMEMHVKYVDRFGKELRTKPRVIMIGSKNRTQLDEDTIEILDDIPIEICDVIVNPSDGEMNGQPYRTVYVQTMYVKIYEDTLDLKYAESDLPEPD